MWLRKDGYLRRGTRRHHLIQDHQAPHNRGLSIRAAGREGLRYDQITSVHQMEVKCQQFSL